MSEYRRGDAQRPGPLRAHSGQEEFREREKRGVETWLNAEGSSGQTVYSRGAEEQARSLTSLRELDAP